MLRKLPWSLLSSALSSLKKGYLTWIGYYNRIEPETLGDQRTLNRGSSEPLLDDVQQALLMFTGDCQQKNPDPDDSSSAAPVAPVGRA